ncbi:MAG: PQQ-binding-like beta-propeller repeat protein [Cyclobacteriaceae bacterium]|nr:PQQ-binding-like beta-propeller repeat protein [Cyclobacteriaceae bacterium]
MKLNITSFTLIALIVCSSLQLNAQLTPAWSTKISQVDWMRITSLGYPIVSSAGALSALDPETGAILWQARNLLGNPREEEVEELWGTRYLKVSYGTERGDDTMPMIALVDIITGAVMFDSRKERLGVLGSYPLAQSGKFMVVGVEPGKFSAKLLMYDMETGNKLWENDEIFKGSQGKGGLMGKMAGAIQSVMNMSSLTSDPVEIDKENIIITHPSYVIKLKSADGSTVWCAKINESTSARLLFTDTKPNIVFVGAETESESMMSSGSGPPKNVYSTSYYAFDLNSGQSVWKSPVKNSNERINYMLPTAKGFVILPGFSTNQQKSTLNLLDYNNGSGLWGSKGNGIKADGEVIDILPTENGLVISTSATPFNQNKSENYFLNVLNVENGSLRFSKSVKVKGRLVRTDVVAKGILYTTTHEVNIVDANTGATLLSNSIESGGPKRLDKILPFPTALRDNKFYVFATKEGIVKELDTETGVVRNLNSVKLELGGKEIPKSLDAFDDGVVLCSDQNVVMIGYDGLLKFSNYFTPPKQSGLMRALALAEVSKGALLTVALASASVTYAGIVSSSVDAGVKQAGSAAAALTGGMAAYSLAYTGKALADFNKRFKATTMADDYLIVLSEVAAKDFRLLKVDKRTGKTLVTLDLGKDRDPLYLVDFIDQHVYHQSKPNEISCFKLK